MRAVRRLGGAVGAVALATVASAAWASAAEPPTSDGGTYCIATLEHIALDSDEARVAHKECYGSLAEQLRHAGQGVGDAFAGRDTGTSAESATVASEPVPRTGRGNSCVARLEHVGDGTSEARVVSETCFGTPQEALRKASVVLEPSGLPSDVQASIEGQGFVPVHANDRGIVLVAGSAEP